LAELSDYDVVLTTYHVSLYFYSYTGPRRLGYAFGSHDRHQQTMALEWPDYEAEMKKKVKKPKDGDDFIVDDEDTGKSKGKKKAQQRLFPFFFSYETEIDLIFD